VYDIAEQSPFFERQLYFQTLSLEYPAFIDRYICLPLLQRLQGIGLLCGTDWTPLYHNRFFYSRFEHSIGVALIVWNFTHDRAQTLAGLFHDISTPAFSHVNDFRRGDALYQQVTELDNKRMIDENKELRLLLAEDGLSSDCIHDYHQYPVCDNEIPHLSADRLEYMFPSGMILDGSWDMESFKRVYTDICVMKNEVGIPELGFNNPELAAEYCIRCCQVGLELQKNENKLALSLLGKIITVAVAVGIVSESDCFSLSEHDLLSVFSSAAEKNYRSEFGVLFRTFTRMRSIIHSDVPLPSCYCVSLAVKKRYIDPLVMTESGPVRITKVHSGAAAAVAAFHAYTDTAYGCVPLEKSSA
jgi:uncharacterized protein